MLDRLIVVFENIVTQQLKLLGAFKLKGVTALPENFPIQQKDRLFHKIKLRKLLYKTTIIETLLISCCACEKCYKAIEAVKYDFRSVILVVTFVGPLLTEFSVDRMED